MDDDNDAAEDLDMDMPGECEEEDDPMEGAEPDDDAGPAGGTEPMSKSDLYAAYKGKGPYQMYCDIMQDMSLTATAEMLTRITRPC